MNQTQEEVQEIKKITDKAVEKSYDHAHIEWRKMALECLRVICETKQEFTMNDVRSLVKMSPLKTHDNRAMGGVVKSGRQLGWFKPSGNSIISKVGHGVPLQIWQSLIFKGNATQN